MTLLLQSVGRQIKGKRIVHNLSFLVKQDECLVLVGPSGCGKSSTLRLIAGLDHCQQGTIKFGNRNVTHLPPSERAVGMVFQSYALLPHLTVYENLALGLRIRGVRVEERSRRIQHILDLVQLADRANHRPSALSGGQRQRVALARALLRDAMVYLLDEPMSNLDAQLREQIRPELRRLILDQGKPTVYVTHDQNEALAMANKIAIINNGEIIQLDAPIHLYNDPNSLFVAKFLGRPQINCLKPRDQQIQAIRPEDLKFSESGLPCRLVSREWLGNTQLFYLESAEGDLRMVAEPSFQCPERLFVTWQQSKVLRFDARTGLRTS